MIRITMAYIKSQGTRPKLKKQRSKTNCPSFVLLTPNSSSILNLKHLRIFFFTLFIMRKYLTLKLFTHHGNQGFTLVTVIFIHYSSSLEFESFIGRSFLTKYFTLISSTYSVRISTGSEGTHVNIKAEFPYFNKLM